METVELSYCKPVAVKIDTAAKMADVSRCTIYTWLRAGKLKTIRVGTDQRILVKEFEEFLRAGHGASTPRKLTPVARPKIR